MQSLHVTQEKSKFLTTTTNAANDFEVLMAQNRWKFGNKNIGLRNFTFLVCHRNKPQGIAFNMWVFNAHEYKPWHIYGELFPCVVV